MFERTDAESAIFQQIQAAILNARITAPAERNTPMHNPYIGKRWHLQIQ